MTWGSTSQSGRAMLFADAHDEKAAGVSLPSATPANALPSGQSRLIPIVTYVLVGISAAMFAAMALARMFPVHSGTQELVRWGANFGPLTLSGQWWRLLTSVFVHIGLVHLAVNMWCLWDLGSFAERIYGRATFLAIYLVSGIAGAMFSLVWHPFAVEAGASGAIFGIAGALIASFCFGALPFPRKSAMAALFSVLAFAGYNLFVGMLSSGAGNAAHIGGLVSGLALGILLARFSAQRLAWTLAAASIVLGCVLLARTRGYVPMAEQGRTALAEGHTDAAINALNQALRKNPDFADGYFLLGQANMQKQQFPAAEAAYRHALALQPKAGDAQYQLGMAVLAQSRATDALAIFSDLAKREPANVPALMGVGTTEELAGNFQGGLEAFRRAAKLDPGNPQTYQNIGIAALQLRQFDEAISAFSKCVDLQPNDPQAMLNLALAYKSNGMEKQAEETYQHAVELAQKQKTSSPPR
jgi:membrane associated rhomboid family serine protease/Flp pilus assembly protein TadD